MSDHQNGFKKWVQRIYNRIIFHSIAQGKTGGNKLEKWKNSTIAIRWTGFTKRSRILRSIKLKDSLSMLLQLTQSNYALKIK